MDEYLNKGIKEIIDAYPEVASVLNDFDIGCGPCNVGTCLLKDIVAIHRLPEDQEQELMRRIAKTLGQPEDTRIATISKKTEAEPKEFNYSPPIKKLVDEHLLIKRWISLIPEVIKRLDVESEANRQLIRDGLDMIRSYADKFHHAKEEEILFKYFDENSDILKVMHQEHTQARDIVKVIDDALEKKNQRAVAENLMKYRDLLGEHIRKEDEILYPWMDNQLSTHQIGELYSKFHQADQQIEVLPKKYEAFIDRLEKKFK